MNARLILPALFLLSTTTAFAQELPPGGPGVAMHHQHDGKEMHDGPGSERGMGHDMDHGMFWKDPKVIAALAITPDQLKKMEDLFIQSRVKLIDLHASLEKEQLLLDPIMNANPVDQPKASAEIDKIADTRAALEKINAKMFLSIRSVLTADQFTKLQAMHGAMHHHEGHGPDGPQGPGTHQHHGMQPPPGGPAPSTPPAE